MKEVRGDLWDFHRRGEYAVITTNGFVKKSGECVMGRGVALQAARKFPDLPKELGKKILQLGNIPICFDQYRIITFPVKHNWFEPADPKLIVESARRIVEHVNDNPYESLYLVRPGCGNGKLDWSEVKPLLEPLFDDRFIIVNQ